MDLFTPSLKPYKVSLSPQSTPQFFGPPRVPLTRLNLCPTPTNPNPAVGTQGRSDKRPFLPILVPCMNKGPCSVGFTFFLCGKQRGTLCENLKETQRNFQWSHALSQTWQTKWGQKVYRLEIRLSLLMFWGLSCQTDNRGFLTKLSFRGLCRFASHVQVLFPQVRHKNSTRGFTWLQVLATNRYLKGLTKHRL